MVVDERRRIELHRQATLTWGEEAADTLMQLGAPAGEELATRTDLERLEERLERRFDAIDARFDAIDVRFESIDARLDAMDGRFDAMDGRFDAMDGRFDAMHSQIERAMDIRFKHAEELARVRFEEAEERTRARFEEAEDRNRARFEEAEERNRIRFERAEAQWEGLGHRISSDFYEGITKAVTIQTRTLVISQLGAVVVIAGLAFGLS